MSALVCISTNFITACIIFFFAYHAFTPDPVEAETDAVEVSADGEQHLYSEARRRDLRNSGQRICRASSPSPSNNTGRLAVKSVYSRSKGPENRESSSHFQPLQTPPSTNGRPPSTHGRRLRSASFPPCRWDPVDVQTETGQGMGAAARGTSSTSCRGRQDLYSGIPMADIQGCNDSSADCKGFGKRGERRTKVTTLHPLTYSNNKKSEQSRNTDNVDNSQIKGKTKHGERYDGGSTSRDNDTLEGVNRNKTSRGEAHNDGINYAMIENERHKPQTTQLEKSLSFDSGVQQILPAFTVFKANQATNKPATSPGRGGDHGNVHLEGQGLYMRRMPDGAPAEPPHTQHSSLTRAKSEELCSPRDEEKTVRKRSPNKTKSKFGSSFRKIIPRR